MKTYLLIALVLLAACGSRKVVTSTVKQQVEQESEQNKDIEQTEQRNTNTQTNVTKQEEKTTRTENKTGVSFTSNQPVRIGKNGIEFTPNGQVNINLSSYYEDKLSLVRDSASKVSDSLSTLLRDRTQEVNRLKQEIKAKDKQTDKEGNVVTWGWVVFGVLGLAIVAYFVYKFFTSPSKLK